MQQRLEVYMTTDRWQLLAEAQQMTGQSQAGTIETALRAFVEQEEAEEL